MATVNLPAIPKEAEFEELIAALMQSSGYYIERRIEQSDQGVQVLELDIITTDYMQSPPEIRIHEVKSGKWGLKDIFKVGGWMRYLDIQAGSFVVHDNPILEAREKCTDVGSKLGIQFVCVPDVQKPQEIIDQLVERARYNPADVAVWRFSYWLERRILDRLSSQRKSGPQRFPLLFEHARSITNGVFFQPTIVGRLNALYDAYKRHPHLSAVVASEIQTGTLDPSAATVPSDIFARTFYDGEDNAVQTASFLEHRARLAVMKAGIDYILYKRAGETAKAETTWRLRLGGTILEGSDFDMLPQTFRDGLAEIQDQPFVHLYPLFWQWFMWAFGGFILTDLQDLEYKALSERTGIPVEEIPSALDAYDALFPIGSRWLVDRPYTNMQVLRMFPVPFRGLGAHYRRLLHTTSGDLTELPLGGMYTKRNMEQEIGVLVKLLS